MSDDQKEPIEEETLSEGWKTIELNGTQRRRMVQKCTDEEYENQFHKKVTTKGCGQLIYWRYYKKEQEDHDGPNFKCEYPSGDAHTCSHKGFGPIKPEKLEIEKKGASSPASSEPPTTKPTSPSTPSTPAVSDATAQLQATNHISTQLDKVIDWLREVLAILKEAQHKEAK